MTIISIYLMNIGYSTLMELLVLTLFWMFLILYFIPKITVFLTRKATCKEFNKIKFFPLPDHETKSSRMPYPEMQYGIGFYKLESHFASISIMGNIPKNQYWSISIHDENSLPVWVASDKDIMDSKFELTIYSKKNKDEEIGKNKILFNSPSKNGMIVLRYLNPLRSSELSNEHLETQKSIKLSINKS